MGGDLKSSPPVFLEQIRADTDKLDSRSLADSLAGWTK